MDSVIEQQFAKASDPKLGLPTAHCVACKEDIRPGAAICTKCKTPQNWTRYIFNWKDLGSAILALIPLWTGAFALWTFVFREPAAELRAVAARCEQQRVVLALVNDGDSAAALNLPALKIVRGGQTTPSKVELTPDPSTQYPYLLGPKQSSSVTLRPQVASLAAPLPTNSQDTPETCTLKVEVIFRGFKAREGIASAQCPCPS